MYPYCALGTPLLLREDRRGLSFFGEAGEVLGEELEVRAFFSPSSFSDAGASRTFCLALGYLKVDSYHLATRLDKILPDFVRTM